MPLKLEVHKRYWTTPKTETSCDFYIRFDYNDPKKIIIEYHMTVHLFGIIIQQIVTMPIYGKETLNICHPYVTDILRYT